jgi:hypothetical protein
MEQQGMSKETLEKLYDAGYTNALMQLRGHINAFIEKPNSQVQKVFELMDFMLEAIEEEKGVK